MIKISFFVFCFSPSRKITYPVFNMLIITGVNDENRKVKMVWTYKKDDRLPNKIYEWMPKGRRKNERPKLTWTQGIAQIMME